MTQPLSFPSAVAMSSTSTPTPHIKHSLLRTSAILLREENKQSNRRRLCTARFKPIRWEIGSLLVPSSASIELWWCRIMRLPISASLAPRLSPCSFLSRLSGSAPQNYLKTQKTKEAKQNSIRFFENSIKTKVQSQKIIYHILLFEMILCTCLFYKTNLA